MELTLVMDSIMDHMDFVWNFSKNYEFQTQGLLGFHPNQRCNEIMIGKTLNDTRKVWNPPFEDVFMG